MANYKKILFIFKDGLCLNVIFTLGFLLFKDTIQIKFNLLINTGYNI